MEGIFSLCPLFPILAVVYYNNGCCSLCTIGIDLVLKERDYILNLMYVSVCKEWNEGRLANSVALRLSYSQLVHGKERMEVSLDGR